MTRKTFSFALPIVAILGAVLTVAPAAPTAHAKPFVFKSVDVTLPDSDRAFPDGPGMEAVQNNCTACHSPGMILNQPAMAKPAWQAEVTKMRNVYKAPIDDKDVTTIVDYLTAVKGAQ
jgi:predicted CxxxxCH...CXXCH cytochrome family protein